MDNYIFIIIYDYVFNNKKKIDIINSFEFFYVMSFFIMFTLQSLQF
jgi:hypothetical protein